jgi:hypothetical protein
VLSVYLILSAALGTGIYSVSNRNEYKTGMKSNLGGVERGRSLRLTSSPSVGQLSRQCEILNVSQLYSPPQPLMRIAFIVLS